MSRMADRVLRAGLKMPPYAPAAEQAALAPVLSNLTGMLRKCLPQGPVLAVDNAVDYFYAGTAQEDWEWARDFPCLAPLFPSFWMETAAPRRIISERHGEILSPFSPIQGWGVLVLGMEWDAVPDFVREEFGLLLPRLPEPPRWLLRMLVCMESQKLSIFPVGVRVLLLDEAGRAIYAREPGRSSMHDVIFTNDPLTRQLVRDWNETLCLPFGLALSFLHCRNVHLVERRPPAALARAHARKHGHPLFRYHVLEIEPMKRVLRTEGRAEEVGLQKALHICRGHFKDYRERGLFGKHRGIYWWDSYVRGDLQRGAVQKDYRLLAPAVN